ncbi:MAG: alpha/beta fold hydrolase [Longimicrobiales bacterium]|nr:alpha/beta fold hydrolase [Longimicrobiales bacterium]
MTRSVRHEDVMAADGTRLALYRVGDPEGPPVVLMPGTFSNHTFWLGTRGHGMAWALARAGYEAIVLDPRGHGGSERHDGRGWTFEDWGRLDVPAAVEAATRDSEKALLIGHSAGGAALLIALAGEPELRDRVAALVALATPVPWLQRWRKLGAWLIRAVSRVLGRFPARLLGLGPEDELPGVMAQWMTWNLRGEWIGDDATDYVRALGEVRVPILAVSGAGDTTFAPPDACRGLMEMVGTDDATYVLAGRETGFSEDFTHPGIVVSKPAHDEVWPLVIDWLDAHASGPSRAVEGDLHPQ